MRVKRNRIPTTKELTGRLEPICDDDWDSVVTLRIYGNKTANEAFEYICSGKECDYAFLESFYFMEPYAFWYYFPVLRKIAIFEEKKHGEIDEIYLRAIIYLLLKHKNEILDNTEIVVPCLDYFEKSCQNLSADSHSNAFLQEKFQMLKSLYEYIFLAIFAKKCIAKSV